MRHSSSTSFVGLVAIALMAAAELTACGGNFTSNSASGGGGGEGGSPGAGGVGNHDSGIPADASILVDSNNPNCPASAPTPYSPCPSERSVCVYEDGLGCSRWFICTMQVSFFAAATTGVGGSFPTNSQLVWIENSPTAGDACDTPGKICTYPNSFPSRLVCTENHTWEATTSTTTDMSTSVVSTSNVTTNGSTAFTAGTGTSTGGQGGAGGLGGDDNHPDAGHP